MFALQATWFVLVVVLLAGYAVLDGFDLGVGVWYLLARDDRDRRAMLRTIAPVWDGNEVWLVTAGGALFAAFPHVYATAFSGFYLATMLVLVSLILRGAAVEFRNRSDWAAWRKGWDAAFAGGSIGAAVLFGVALGNVLGGVPLDAQKNFTGSFWSLLNPYALGVGATGLLVLATHGALYLAGKADGALRARARTWARRTSWAAAAAFFALGAATIHGQARLLRNYRAAPALWAAPAIVAVLVVCTVVACRRATGPTAFMLSAAAIAGSMALVGVGLFPDLIPASNDPALSLTAANASSSALTLKIMLVLAGAGMPVVIGYQIWVHRAFRGPLGQGEDLAY